VHLVEKLRYLLDFVDDYLAHRVGGGRLFANALGILQVAAVLLGLEEIDAGGLRVGLAQQRGLAGLARAHRKNVSEPAADKRRARLNMNFNYHDYLRRELPDCGAESAHTQIFQPEDVGGVSGCGVSLAHFLWLPQLRDAGDEMVLEAAVNGRADALVLVSFNVRDSARHRHGSASNFCSRGKLS
jgi:hypothetical protein